jgi:hypothetical protein
MRWLSHFLLVGLSISLSLPRIAEPGQSGPDRASVVTARDVYSREPLAATALSAVHRPRVCRDRAALSFGSPSFRRFQRWEPRWPKEMLLVLLVLTGLAVVVSLPPPVERPALVERSVSLHPRTLEYGFVIRLEVTAPGSLTIWMSQPDQTYETDGGQIRLGSRFQIGAARIEPGIQDIRLPRQDGLDWSKPVELLFQFEPARPGALQIQFVHPLPRGAHLGWPLALPFHRSA